MKSFLTVLGLLVGAIVAIGLPLQAHAVTTSDLNCAFSGGVCSDTSSYGTLTFTDLGDDVQLDIDLTGTGNKILSVKLNYDGSPDGDDLSVTGDATTLTFSPDGVNADGCVGCFDIDVPATGEYRYDRHGHAGVPQR